MDISLDIHNQFLNAFISLLIMTSFEWILPVAGKQSAKFEVNCV